MYFSVAIRLKKLSNVNPVFIFYQQTIFKKLLFFPHCLLLLLLTGRRGMPVLSQNWQVGI